MAAPPAYQQASYHPAPAQVPPQASKDDIYRQLALRHEISDEWIFKLKQQLSSFDIVLLCDDSGSMNEAVQPTPDNNWARTRWDELKITVRQLVDFAATLDQDGCDVMFLNRQGLANVKSPQAVDQLFVQPPSGRTPISRALRTIYQVKNPGASEKNLLIVIATDGAPTDDRGQIDIRTMREVLSRERDRRVYIQFLVCTDAKDDEVAYLEEFDRKLPRVDVCDDYLTEKRQIQARHHLKSKYRFTRGDYLCKLLLGSVDPTLDKADEGSTCCSVQ